MLELTSPAFASNASIPEKYTCNGARTNPPLQVSGVPPAARSLALIVYDPDVPKSVKADGRYSHWVLWNLTPSTTAIEEGKTGGIAENGSQGYIPPCPPNGEHRYVFQLFALDRTLGDVKIAREDDLRQQMQGHVLERAELVGRYSSTASTLANYLLPAVVVGVLIALAYKLIANRGRA